MTGFISTLLVLPTLCQKDLNGEELSSILLSSKELLLMGEFLVMFCIQNSLIR